jgi:hypothetical protein
VTLILNHASGNKEAITVVQLTDKEFSSLFFSLFTHLYYCFREMAGYSLMVFVFVRTCTHLCVGGPEGWEGSVVYHVPGHTEMTPVGVDQIHINTLRTGIFFLYIYHGSLIRSEVTFL